MNIIVNGKTVVVPVSELTGRLPKLSYADVVQLGEEPQGPTYSMTYKSGLGVKLGDHGDHVRQGILFPGAEVEIVEGMVFNFIVTGSA